MAHILGGLSPLPVGRCCIAEEQNPTPQLHDCPEFYRKLLDQEDGHEGDWTVTEQW